MPRPAPCKCERCIERDLQMGRYQLRLERWRNYTGPRPQTYDGFPDDLDFLLQQSCEFPDRPASEFPDTALLSRVRHRFLDIVEKAREPEEQVIEREIQEAASRQLGRLTWEGIMAFWVLAVPSEMADLEGLIVPVGRDALTLESCWSIGERLLHHPWYWYPREEQEGLLDDD